MFKGGNGKAPNPTNSPDKLNRIVEGTSLKGEIKSDSNIRLDGFLDGTLDTTGKLVVGTTGRVEGEIRCSNADIEGEIVGDITVDGLLLIKSTAKITGKIVAGKIGIENGAEFNGTCNMSGQAIDTPVSEELVDEKATENELVY